MNFGESILFAAIMTLMDEIKNKEKNEISDNINESSYTYDDSAEMTYDALSAKNKLCMIAQDLFDKADEMCQTATDMPTNGIISSLINRIIFETVDAIDDNDSIKKEIYQFCLQYCTIDSIYKWEFFSMDDGRMKDALIALGDAGMDSIIIASNRGQMGEAGVGFIKLMTEFMMYLEDAINKNYYSIVLNKRPPVIVLEMGIAAFEREMKRMEGEDSSVKEQPTQSEETKNLQRLFEDAHLELSRENMTSAAAYYREILKIKPDDWEAMFYSVFCESYKTPHNIKGNDILHITQDIVNCVPNTMRQAKKKLFSRMDIITAMGDVVLRVGNLASNCFVASMNTFKASSGGSTANMNKVIQVNSIIDMLFVLGDSIEENFGDDFEIAKSLSCSCWKIGFDCYENCNMPAHPKLYDHYLKILKYEPLFRCSKPIISSSEGCYIATAVYGSYDCPQVWVLRRYRDYSLTKRWLGKLFIRFYYATSPTFVRLFKDTKWFNVVFRKLLDKFTKYLLANGYKSTPYTDRMSINSKEKYDV